MFVVRKRTVRQVYLPGEGPQCRRRTRPQLGRGAVEPAEWAAAGQTLCFENWLLSPLCTDGTLAMLPQHCCPPVLLNWCDGFLMARHCNAGYLRDWTEIPLTSELGGHKHFFNNLYLEWALLTHTHRWVHMDACIYKKKHTLKKKYISF